MIRIFIILTLIYFNTSFAQDLKAIISPAIENNKLQLDRGDIVDVVFRIWPTHSMNSELFNSMKLHNVSDILTVTEIKKIAVSPNNEDVTEVFATVVVRREFNSGEEIEWDFNGRKIQLEIRDMSSKGEFKEGKEFIVLDQKFSAPVNWSLVLSFAALVALFVLGSVLYFLKRKAKRIKAKKEKERKLRFWKNKFVSAKSRSDYEYIYMKKNSWIEMINVKTPPMINFFETINLHQYKPDWGDREKKEVEEAFDQIREIF